MQFGPDATTEITPPRDAATVLLLRDAPGGFEVFMVKRSGLSDVLGDAHVFPGGKVDAADSSPAMLARVEGIAALNSVAANKASLDVAVLGEDLPRDRAAGLFVAAARETFEEAGVLLSRDAPNDLRDARRRLNAKEPLCTVLESIGATIDAHALVPWTRWVTPAVLRKRFDARFFLALAPSTQTAVHDDHETTRSEWLSPRAALDGWKAGDIKLAPPTFMSLAHLALFDDINSVMSDARSRRPPVLQPLAFEHEGARWLALPGDPRHPVKQRAIPGPTAFRWDGVRFAPE